MLRTDLMCSFKAPFLSVVQDFRQFRYFVLINMYFRQISKAARNIDGNPYKTSGTMFLLPEVTFGKSKILKFHTGTAKVLFT